MVAPKGDYHDVKVIDIDGCVYSFGYYMSICDRRLIRPSAPGSPSRPVDKWFSRVKPIGGSVRSSRLLSPFSSLIRSFSARISASLKG
jgi:hypothetical protein